MPKPTERPWKRTTHGLTKDSVNGALIAFIPERDYEYARQCVNAIDAAGIVKVEELVGFMTKVKQIRHMSLMLLDTPSGNTIDFPDMVDSLARLTGTVSTETSDE